MTPTCFLIVVMTVYGLFVVGDVLLVRWRRTTKWRLDLLGGAHPVASLDPEAAVRATMNELVTRKTNCAGGVRECLLSTALILAGCQTAAHREHVLEADSVWAPAETVPGPAATLPTETAPIDTATPKAEEPIEFASPELARAAAEKIESDAWDVAASDLPRARALWRRARAILEWALRAKPNYFDALYDLGYAYDREGRMVGKTDLDELRVLHTEAAQYYSRAAALQPGHAGLANTWGLMWDHAARLTAPHNLADAQKLWEHATESFLHALGLNPAHHAAANNLGNAFDAAAHVTIDSDFDHAQRLWDLAISAYEWALRIKPDKVNAATNWGLVLSERALGYAKRDPARAKAFWAKAAERFRIAHSMDSTYHSALSSWAESLMEEAKYTAPDDLPRARQLWNEARLRLRMAIELGPSADDLERWAITLWREAEVVSKGDANAAAQLWAECWEKFSQARQLNPVSDHLHQKWGDALIAKSELESARASEKIELLQEAIRRFETAYTVKPDQSYPLERWGFALLSLTKWLQGTDRQHAITVGQAAGEKFRRLLAIEPNHATARYNWATVLNWEAECRPSSDGQRAFLYGKAARLLREHLESQGREKGALQLFAIVLAANAREIAPNNLVQARTLWREADLCVGELLSRYPDDEYVITDCSHVLGVQARGIRVVDPDEAVGLLHRAVDVCAQFQSTRAPSALVLGNWAWSLLFRADITWFKDRDEAVTAWREVIALCERALRVNPDSRVAVNTRAMALMRLYGSWPVAANLTYLDDAEAMLLKGAEAYPDYFAFNLACLYGLKKQPADSVRWLERCRLEGELPSREKIFTDPYLALVRDKAEFQQWVANAWPD